MSSSRTIILAALLASLVAPSAACAQQAQDDIDAHVAKMLENARHAYSVVPPRRLRCPPATRADEIVVCGRDTGGDQRVPSTAETDPNSRAARHALDAGGPRTPWVSNLPDCRIEHCTRVGRAPPPIHIIDLSKIPEPPQGSDADKMSRGELRGD